MGVCDSPKIQAGVAGVPRNLLPASDTPELLAAADTAEASEGHGFSSTPEGN